MNNPVTRRETIIGLGAAFAGALATYALPRLLRDDSRQAARIQQPGGDNLAPANPDTLAPTEVYATKLTAKNFPIISQIADWTQGRIKTIYVLSPEDFDGPLCKKAIKENKNMLRGKASISQTLSRLSDNPQLVSAIQQEVRQKLEGLLGAEIMIHVNDQYIVELSEHIIDGAASCAIVNLNAADASGQIAIIATTYADMTRDMFFFQMTDISPDQLENFEGTDNELRILGLMHEVQHAADRHVGQDLSFEIRADKGAALYWTQELKKGNVTTAGLPEFWQRMRAITTFLSSEYSHATNAAIRSGNENNAPVSSDKIFVESRNLVVRLARGEVRARVIPPTHFARGLHNLLYDALPYEGGEKIALSLADEKIIKEMLASITNAEWAGIEAQFEQLTQPVREKVRQIADTMSEDAATLAMKHNPALFYAAVADLQRTGAFRSNPIADQYAWEFLEAAKRHASKYFKTDDYQEHEFAPPAFDEKGQPVEQHLGIVGPG